MELSDIVGRKVLEIVPNTEVRHPFDPDASGVIFTLDNTTYLIFEDPSDGYRSNAGAILSFEGSAYGIGSGSWFPTYLREPVLCRHQTESEYHGTADILEVLSEATGAVIFRVGTDNTYDYYPSFVCEWKPEGLSANSKGRMSDAD